MKSKQIKLLAIALILVSAVSLVFYFRLAEAATSKNYSQQSTLKKTSLKKKTTKKQNKKSIPQGTWNVVAIYDQAFDGSFTANTIWPVDTYGFTVSFKNKGFCTTHWRDAIDDSKLHCEEPLVFNPDGTFFGKDAKLQAFGGFMKLNGSQLEWYEKEKGGFTKYVLEKKK